MLEAEDPATTSLKAYSTVTLSFRSIRTYDELGRLTNHHTGKKINNKTAS
jgi:hypothetical protein